MTSSVSISSSGVFPLLNSSKSSLAAATTKPLLSRASQLRSSLPSSRHCSSTQCSSSGRFVADVNFLDAFSSRSSFACKEFSAYIINANSRLGLKKPWRRTLRVCAKDQREETPPPVYSADTKIRSEVISPFRSFRMFFYLAFIASGTIGTLITLTRVAASLSHAPNAQPIPDILKDLGIDVAAVTLFGLLYRSDAKARDVSLARISREEMLSNLRVELPNKKVVTLQQLRGVARIVIISGTSSHVKEAFEKGEPFKQDLLERGVVVVPYSVDGGYSTSDSSTGGGQQNAGSVAVQELPKVATVDKWTAMPIYTGEWSKWLHAQKKLANVADDWPVYISLRLDGRVRGSGLGYPPWAKLAAQLPPMAGIWRGPLDGMDGRV